MQHTSLLKLIFVFGLIQLFFITTYGQQLKNSNEVNLKYSEYNKILSSQVLNRSDLVVSFIAGNSRALEASDLNKIIVLDSTLQKKDSLNISRTCNLCYVFHVLPSYVSNKINISIGSPTGNNFRGIIILDNKLSIIDTLKHKIHDKYSFVDDYLKLKDTTYISGYGTDYYIEPFFEVRANGRTINDSILSQNNPSKPSYLKPIDFDHPIFWNDRFYTISKSNERPLISIHKDGKMDTLADIFNPQNPNLEPISIPLRLIPGTSSRKLKLLTYKNESKNKQYFYLQSINLNNFSRTILDSFQFDTPLLTTKNIGPVSIETFHIWNDEKYVDWNDLHNIYFGATRGYLGVPELAPRQDSSLKRFIHLYSIDSSGNANWYRRFGDGHSYYKLQDVTARKNGVYVTGLKYDWKNPSPNYTTQAFIMSINEKGELIGTRHFDLPKSKISVYPNPATDHVKIEGLEKHHTFYYKLYRSNGQMVEQGEMKTTQIPVSHLPEGNYFLSIEDQDHQSIGSKKIVVQ